MKGISKEQYSKYFLISFFVIVIILAFLLLKTLLAPLLVSVVTAYLFYPLYKKINLKIKNKSIVSLIMIIILLFLLTTPLVFIVNSLVGEATSLYNIVKSLDIQLDPNIQEAVNEGLLYVVNVASSFILSIPNKILSLVISLFILFYLFRDGETILKKLKALIPLEKKQKDLLFDETKNIVGAVIYGLVLTGIIEGIIGAIGFFIFDIPSPILWGFAMMILTILPAVGTSLIWIPAGIIKLLNNDLFNGIGILIYGALIITSVETILKPRLIGKKAKIHPLIIILGVFGGLKLLGFIGIILGPLILAILTVLVKFIGKNKFK